jgi:hypothetical protein
VLVMTSANKNANRILNRIEYHRPLNIVSFYEHTLYHEQMCTSCVFVCTRYDGLFLVRLVIFLAVPGRPILY